MLTQVEQEKILTSLPHSVWGLNKIKVGHIQNIHFNFLLPLEMARQHLVKGSGLRSTQ